MTGTTVVCPACGETAGPAARFCEACGASLTTSSGPPPVVAEPSVVPPPVAHVTTAGTADGTTHGTTHGTADGTAPGTARPCTQCGGRVAADGWCEECGAPAPSERDHFVEVAAPWVAGVCDRGVRHARNEDALALAAGGSGPTSADRTAALVVCDGVSSAPHSDVASLRAARAARDVLAAAIPTSTSAATPAATPAVDPGPDRPVTSARIAAWTDRLVAASRAAGDAVRATAEELGTLDDPPSCTFAAAVVDGPLLVAGWVGDSRVLWVPDDGEAQQLSVDDSWAQDMIAQGMDRRTAENAPQGHAITRWLGPDAHDADARCTATVPGVPGWVVVCSDGLWNYCSPAHELGALVRAAVRDRSGDPAAAAADLVRWANQQGGRDNVTVALARFDTLPITTPSA